jgi:bacterioferritin
VGAVRHGNALLADRAAAQRALLWVTGVRRNEDIMQSDHPDNAATGRLQLDERALDAAKRNSSDGVVTPAYGPWRQDIVRLLNDALATELTCVMRYRRHHFTAQGVDSAKIAEEFLVHANEEMEHADRLAERIVQLGGEPDFRPDTLPSRSHSDYDDSGNLNDMIRTNLIAERVAIEAYRQMIGLIGDKDPTTRRLIEEILAVEEEHADELRDWLAR